MEVEQKTEAAEKENIQVDAGLKPNKVEEEMEIDAEPQKVEVEETEDVKPLILKVESKCEDIGNLVVEGIESGDDDEEEFIIMSPEEIRLFLEQKISEHVRDPRVNPLLALEKHTHDLLDDIKDKAEEISKLSKALDVLYRNQEKFLRHMDIFPKVPTNSVSVSVDLPLLLDSVPLMSKAVDEEAVIRKDLSDAKVLSPSVSRAKPPPAPLPSGGPQVPKGTSITPIPNASPKPTPPIPSVATPAVKSPPKAPPQPAGDIECIDLTEESPAKTNSSPMAAISLVKHPAPLPPKPFSATNTSLPNVPPKPRLKISSEERGIVLQWDMPPAYSTATAYSKLKAFDIFGYQEQRSVVINTLLWKKIGSVAAMSLPMACTLTQFLEGQKYHFAVRAVDAHDRCGAYSDPISIVYRPAKKV